MRHNTRRGAFAIEFSLTLPVWLALVFGTFDVSWLMYRVSAVSAGAAAGCRAGALIDPGAADVNLSAIEAAVLAAATDELAVLGVSATGLVADATIEGAAPDRRLVCTVSQPIPSLTAYVLPSVGVARVRTSQLQWQHEGAP